MARTLRPEMEGTVHCFPTLRASLRVPTCIAPQPHLLPLRNSFCGIPARGSIVRNCKATVGSLWLPLERAFAL